MELTAEQIAELIKVSPHWLEVTYWSSQILILVVLIFAAIYAKQQLVNMRSDSEQNLKIAQARLMLELDSRWDSVDMQDARKLFVTTNEDIGKMVAEEFPLINEQSREEKIKEKWLAHLSLLRKQDIDSYTKIMSMCGFFETVGLMVDRGYIAQNDMFSLFLGPIMAIDRCFSKHIEERSKEMGVPKGLYQHALNLCSCAKEAHT